MFRVHIVSHEVLTSSLCVHLLFSQRIWVVLSSLQRVDEWLVQLICFCWVHFFFIDFWSGQAVAWRDSCLKLTALIVCCTGLGLPPFFLFFLYLAPSFSHAFSSVSLSLSIILLVPTTTDPASHFNNCNIARVHKDNQVYWYCMLWRVRYYIISFKCSITLLLYCVIACRN